ncbi:hypothetical protein RDI58_012217 [Solanum bulbocastanum]|uniref:AT-hook motif nuclear-localized protein n=1 Tax=Solanum bulbocastanum TaxID=147425 RepID=A0AAN8YIE5_SOLBU
MAEKIIFLAKDGPKSVNILSATGKIAKVIITRRPTEIETHEGLYNIVSLSGSFMSDEVEGQLLVTGGLYISLATDYGISFKDRVAGALAAASPVERAKKNPSHHHINAGKIIGEEVIHVKEER